MKFRSMLCCLTLASVCLAAAAPAHADQARKGIKIAGEADTAANPKPIELTVRPGKERFAVNEKITLMVKASQDSYLYISTRTSSGDAVLLSPNPSGKLLQVKAGEQKIETNLIGDTDNETDEITVVASSADLGISGLTAKNFNTQLRAKGIRIAADDTQPKPPAGVSVSDAVKVQIRISNGDPAEADGLALVTTDKRRYELGDKIQVAYGASKPGWVNVFMTYPDGSVQQVVKDKFEQPTVKTVAAEVVAPQGRQTLVAVWSTDGNVDADTLRSAGYGKGDDATATKDLMLRGSRSNGRLTVNITNVEVAN